MSASETPGPAPAAPSPAANPNMYVDLAKHHVGRAFTWNLQDVPVAPAERPLLLAADIKETTLQKYFAWRRSLLMCVIVPLAIDAVLTTIDQAKTGTEGLSELGKTVAWSKVAGHWAMPLAAYLAVQAWTNSRVVQTRLLLGWAIGFFIPIVTALIPLEKLLQLGDGPIDMATAQQIGAAKVGKGLSLYFELTPPVLTLLPAMIRSSVRVKTLAPGAVLPGWFLLMASPLYMMFWLVIFVAVNYFAGNALLVAGVLLFITAPIHYILKWTLFVRPLTPGEIAPIGPVQKRVITSIFVGLGIILVYMLTAKFGDKTIMGSNDANSMIRPWNIDFLRFIFDYLARSLFLTAMFADILIRMCILAHRSEQSFVDDPARKDYDYFVDAAQKAMPPIPLPIISKAG